MALMQNGTTPGQGAGGGPAAAILRNASVRFGSFTAIEDLSLEIGQGAFYTILGPSGCGKSTLTRAILGLEELQGGEIRLDGEKVMVESLLAFKRAGCDGILTYFAPAVARLLAEKGCGGKPPSATRADDFGP